MGKVKPKLLTQRMLNSPQIPPPQSSSSTIASIKSTSQSESKPQKPFKDDFSLSSLLPVLSDKDSPMYNLLVGMDSKESGLPLSSPAPLYPRECSLFNSQSALHVNGNWNNGPHFEPFHLNISYQLPFALPDEQARTNPSENNSSSFVKIPPAVNHFKSFSDETLFFIFYSYAKDHMQISVAHELHKRGWFFHKALRSWMMRDPSADISEFHKGKFPFETRRQGQRVSELIPCEQGPFLVFDILTWSSRRKIFTLRHDLIENLSTPITSSPQPNKAAQ